MMNFFNAIRSLNPNIVTIRDDIAYDKDENVIEYDKAAAQAKFEELEATNAQAQQAAEAAKQSALTKLTKLGLTADEIAALIG